MPLTGSPRWLTRKGVGWRLLGGLMLKMRFVALAGAALLVPASIAAQDPGAAAAASAAVTQVQRLDTAAQLAAYGREMKDPYAMIAAARMEMAVAPASADYKPVAKSGAKDAHVGDHKAHGTAYLDEATAMARGDKTILAAIDSTRSGVRGATCGCKIGYYRAQAGDVHRYTISFRGNELAELLIVGDGYSDLDVAIYNQYGKLVKSDNGSSTRAYASWYPSTTAPYMIEVSNVGSNVSTYRLTTN